MEDKIRACLIPVGEEPREIEIPADNSLKTLQNAVGGLVEVLNVKGDGIDLWVNEEGLFTQQPNRAMFADKHMEQEGYLSQLDYATEVKDGDLYTVLFGNIVATRHDDEGGLASLTDADIVALKQEYADPSTGYRAVLAIKQGQEYRREQSPSAVEEHDGDIRWSDEPTNPLYGETIDNVSPFEQFNAYCRWHYGIEFSDKERAYDLYRELADDESKETREKNTASLANETKDARDAAAELGSNGTPQRDGQER